MPVDATGTVTTKFGIPKYATGADAPSGKGLNNIMDSLDTILSNLGIAGLVANDIPLYDSVAGKWKKATGTPSASTFLRGDGSWASAMVGKITTSGFAAGPPGSPTDGDIWIGTSVDANGTRWAFQYNAGSGSAFKWECIGGGTVVARTAGGTLHGNNTNFENPSALTYSVVRAGDYIGRISGRYNNTAAVNQVMNFNVGAGAVSPTEFSATPVFNATTFPFSREDRLLAVAAATAIQPRHQTQVASVGLSVDFEVLTVVPIRVA